jgi:hypothetical protein
MKPEQVRCVFIVSQKYIDHFCHFLGEKSWVEKDFEGYKREFRNKYCLLLTQEEELTKKVLDTFYDIKYKEKMFYLIGANECLLNIDIFSHYIYNTSKEWDIFEKKYKTLYGEDFIT